MKKPRLAPCGVATIAMFIVLAIAIVGAVALAAMPSLWSGRGTANTGFDPLFANQTCAPTRTGMPPLQIRRHGKHVVIYARSPQ